MMPITSLTFFSLGGLRAHFDIRKRWRRFISAYFVVFSDTVTVIDRKQQGHHCIPVRHKSGGITRDPNAGDVPVLEAPTKRDFKHLTAAQHVLIHIAGIHIGTV